MARELTLSEVLRKARPEWNDKTLQRVWTKLKNVDVQDLDDFAGMLISGQINSKLAAAGEKRFNQNSLLKLRTVVKRHVREKRGRISEDTGVAGGLGETAAERQTPACFLEAEARRDAKRRQELLKLPPVWGGGESPTNNSPSSRTRSPPAVQRAADDGEGGAGGALGSKTQSGGRPLAQARSLPALPVLVETTTKVKEPYRRDRPDFFPRLVRPPEGRAAPAALSPMRLGSRPSRSLEQRPDRTPSSLPGVVAAGGGAGTTSGVGKSLAEDSLGHWSPAGTHGLGKRGSLSTLASAGGGEDHDRQTPSPAKRSLTSLTPHSAEGRRQTAGGASSSSSYSPSREETPGLSGGGGGGGKTSKSAAKLVGAGGGRQSSSRSLPGPQRGSAAQQPELLEEQLEQNDGTDDKEPAVEREEDGGGGPDPWTQQALFKNRHQAAAARVQKLLDEVCGPKEPILPKAGGGDKGIGAGGGGPGKGGRDPGGNVERGGMRYDDEALQDLLREADNFVKAVAPAAGSRGGAHHTGFSSAGSGKTLLPPVGSSHKARGGAAAAGPFRQPSAGQHFPPPNSANALSLARSLSTPGLGTPAAAGLGTPFAQPGLGLKGVPERQGGTRPRMRHGDVLMLSQQEAAAAGKQLATEAFAGSKGQQRPVWTEGRAKGWIKAYANEAFVR